MTVQQQEIHIKAASGVASAIGWWAKYYHIEDETKEMCLPLAAWILLQTRTTQVEVPNIPNVPVVMGMIALEGQLGLSHAPAVPNWAFRGYITDEEHDDWMDKQADEQRRKDAKGTDREH